MSSKAVGWAIEQAVRGNEKLVLILLGEAHRVESGLAFPSIRWLVEHTGLDRKTVIRCMDALEAADLIVDTGQRVGKTNQIKCFSLKIESIPKSALLNSKGSVFPAKGPKNGTRNQEDNNTSRAKALSVRAKGFEEIPDDTDAWLSWAMKNMDWSNDAALAELRRFIDSAQAHGRKYIDWMAAWRSWCRSPFCKTKSADDRTAYRKEPLRV